MKNARLLWRLLGYVLIPALFLALGGGLLRAQDNAYTLVTDASTLKAGDVVLLVGPNSNASKYYAMAASFTAANNRQGVEVAVTGNTISPTIATEANKAEACEFTLAKNADGNYSFYDKLNALYIGMDGSNNLPSTADAWYFSVSVANDGVATIYESTQSRYVRFYYMGLDFRSYTSLTGTFYKNVYLYKKQASDEPFINKEKPEVSYRIHPTDNLNEKLSFTAGNLENDVTVSVASATAGQNAVISVSPSAVPKETTAFELTLTTSNLSLGEYSDIITLTSGDITETVTVNLSVKEPVLYKLVKDASTLKAGNVVLIVAENGYAMGAFQATKTGSRYAEEVTVADETITDPTIATAKNETMPCEFTIEKNAEGGYAFNDNLNDLSYLTSTTGNNSPSAADPFYFSVTIDANTGVATMVQPEKDGASARYMRCYSTSGFRLYTTPQYLNIYFYKKQVPEEPVTCDPVTLLSDGSATPTENSVTIRWNAPDAAPANGYKVSVSGPDSYEKSKTVTTTYVEWDDELSSETNYTYSIVSLCDDDLESEAVEGSFKTLAVTDPTIELTAPEDNATFTGDVTVAFTLEDFTLDASHLVKATVKKHNATAQLNEPVIKTVYTQASPFSISGLADGKYHIDLYMVEVRLNAEGSGNDTVVVGFDGSNYAHCNVVVKNPSITFAPTSLGMDTYRGDAVSRTVKVSGWALPANTPISFTSDNSNFTVTPSVTGEAAQATGGAEITVTYNGADATATATAKITATCGSLTATLNVTATLKDALANLKALYGRAKDDDVLVRGKMVVTQKDKSNNRIWVQDIDKENGASMLLYNASNGYADIQVGDVLENVAGTVGIVTGGLRRFTPVTKLTAVEHNHVLYVDTLTAAYINANIATLQHALVCVEKVTFAQGAFTTDNRNLTLYQGEEELTFYTSFDDVDYVDEETPAGLWNVTGLLGMDNAGTARIAARNWADMQEVPVCEDVETASYEVEGSTVHFSWEVEHKPAIGYIIEVLADDAAKTLVKRDTVKNPETLTYDLENVAEGEYTFSITALCGEGNVAEPVGDYFAVHAAGTPSISIDKPASGEFTRDSVMVTCKVANFVLGTGEDAEGSIKYTIRGTNLSAPITGTTTDTFFYQKFERSGKDTVIVELVDKTGAALSPAKTARRAFTINLPDVAAPVFTPAAATSIKPIDVTIESATEGASIFYSLNNAAYVLYTEAIKLETSGTYMFRAFAVKAGMDTGRASKTYTINLPEPLPEGIMFFEPFDGLTGAGNGDLKAQLDDYTRVPGWSGDAVYMQVPGIAKVGTGSKNGYLQTPAIALTAGKQYVLSFDAQAWYKDSRKLTVTIDGEDYVISGLVNGEDVGTGNEPTEMLSFERAFTATAATTIRIASNGTAGKSRFFLDNIKIEEDTEEPVLNVSSNTLSMNTVQGTPVNGIVTVSGRHLAADVTVTCPEGNFTVSPAMLTKEAVMSANGAELTVTFNGAVASDAVEITLACGALTQTISVTATAEEIPVNPCEAPTNLKATVADKNVTLGWEGEAEQYHVVVLLGETTVYDETLTAKTHSLTNLEAGTYSWAVASVCEDGEQRATGESFVIAGGVAPDECEAPTNLKATVADKNVTLSWEGEAEQYHVEVLFGATTIYDDTLTAKTHELKNLEAGTYRWAVASLCEDGEKWATIESFEVKKSTANEDAAGLAFRLYPNPTADVFYVEVAESARMEIFTVGGVMVRRADLVPGKSEFRLNESGIYFVRLTNARGTAVQRVVVR